MPFSLQNTDSEIIDIPLIISGKAFPGENKAHPVMSIKVTLVEGSWARLHAEHVNTLHVIVLVDVDALSNADRITKGSAG